ncbi:MAG TPA: hypothetical protein VFJ02_23000 [Vicinamibacterales bacterium]|nr:hypothetical protein [Vicinamibacterales bacterium]
MNTAIDRRLFDRRLYLTAAVLFPLIVVAGFARTYYLKGVFGTPPLSSNLVHLHGFVMTAWVALFVVQTRLIAAKQTRVHQRLGYAGIALAALVIIVGLPTALRAGKYGFAASPPGIDSHAFMIMPMFDLLMFAIFFGAAVWYRRQPAEHKRLMLLTAINFLPPAVARIPAASLQALGPLWFFGVPTVLALLCVALDARRFGRVNKVFVAGTLLLIASYGTRLALMTSAAWMNVAEWLTSFV